LQLWVFAPSFRVTKVVQVWIVIFLGAFLLDGALAVVALLSPTLAGPVTSMGWILFSISMLLYAASVFSPRIPKRLAWPLAAFLTWRFFCGGFPLPFAAPHVVPAILAWSQVGVGVALMALMLFWQAPAGRPAFTWRNFAISGLVTVTAVPIVFVAATVNSLGVYMEETTGGYLKIRPSGLLLEEREFRNGAKCVRLVSMVHIGNKGFYDQIDASLPRTGEAIVLLEGVTDDQQLLKRHFSYTRLANMFGLESQETSLLQGKAREVVARPSAPGAVEYRDADVDVSTFHPETIQFIQQLGVLLANPTAASLALAFCDPNSPLGKPAAQKTVLDDILSSRNRHLLSEINTALLAHDTVVVPWGAMHLSWIEAELKMQGFHQTASIDRPAIRFLPSQP
jgi:hypothetical protein